MITTIDNNVRVFQVVTSTGTQAFCNIEGLNNVVSELGTREGYFTIYHFWNNKPKKVSKKYLRELSESNNIEFTFTY